MSEPVRIVSIGAHPADVFDQSGGTMAHHTSRGGYVASGEGFIRMNAEVHYHLPLTAYALRQSRDSDHEIMRRYSWRLPMPESDRLDSRPDSLGK